MVQNGYLGIACEPNCVFQICNQPAILGFRLHDLVHGGHRAAEVTRGYELAWAEFGRLGENGHYNIMISEDSRAVRPNLAQAPWVDAWCGALMNMWNRDFVREHYAAQLKDFIVPGHDGALSVNVGGPPDVNGNKVIVDDVGFGWVAAWASEMGDEPTLRGLLAHADRHMNPTWLDGGLYYPRNDTPADDQGHRTMLEPMTGNVLLGYARLNVNDGLFRLYNQPWGRSHHTEPALREVAGDVDVSRAVFHRETATLEFALQRGADCPRDGRVVLGNVDARGPWTLQRNGIPVAKGDGLTVAGDGHSVCQREADGLSISCPGGGIQDYQMIFESLRGNATADHAT